MCTMTGIGCYLGCCHRQMKQLFQVLQGLVLKGHFFPSVFLSICFPLSLSVLITRLPDGFTQLRGLAHLALNDVSLQTLPNDIGK